MRPPPLIVKPGSNHSHHSENGLRKVIEQKTLEATIFANRSTNPNPQVGGFLFECNAELGDNGLDMMDVGFASLALIQQVRADAACRAAEHDEHAGHANAAATRRSHARWRP